MKEVAIVMGSSSDWNTMKQAGEILDSFGVTWKAEVVSAHRNPEGMCQFARSAEKQGYKVIIAGAGGAAHLPGMVSAQTNLPVIGVPIATSNLGGLDSLYSIVQMPKGIPVATVAIGNGVNAGLLAVRMLSLARPELLAKMGQYLERERLRSLEQNQDLR